MPTVSRRGAGIVFEALEASAVPGRAGADDRPPARRRLARPRSSAAVIAAVRPIAPSERLLDGPACRAGRGGPGPGSRCARWRGRPAAGPRRPAAGRPLAAGGSASDGWTPDPHEAILLLHGYSGSIAPDLVEYGPFLRRTAGVLGLDFRGHGDSDDGPSTFGLLEVEDIAGALAWLGERGITRVALFGTSMGGISAIAAVAVLGDGSLAARRRGSDRAARPRAGATADGSSASSPIRPPPELEIPIATRLRGPARGFVAGRLFDGAARTLGRRSTRDRAGARHRPRRSRSAPAHPRRGRHNRADRRRTAAGRAGRPVDRALDRAGGRRTARSHAAAGQDYERRVTDFLRLAFRRGRGEDDGAPAAP